MGCEYNRTLDKPLSSLSCAILGTQNNWDLGWQFVISYIILHVLHKDRVMIRCLQSTARGSPGLIGTCAMSRAEVASNRETELVLVKCITARHARVTTKITRPVPNTPAPVSELHQRRSSQQYYV